MAYIQPNSKVQFFADIGLSPNYENTLYFSSVQNKDNYFNGLTQITPECNALSYSRETRGFIRVEKTMAQLIGAGYMRFKNTSFEDKWFYAFVKSVEYINHTTTQVNFELDVMMTWMGVFHLNECFVERQHNATDAIGDNIVEENLDIGDYVYNAVERTNLMSSYTIIIGASVDQQGDPVAGGSMVNNVYSGIVMHQFGTAEAANLWIDEITDKAKSDALVGAVMCPSQFIVNGQATGQAINISKNINNLDTYTPYNKKLFTYPYNYMQVTNGQGNYATFRYEFFRASATNCGFVLWGVAGLQPEAVLTPVQYRRMPSNFVDVPERLTISGFPQCAFNIDQYKAFLAQNSASITVDAVSTVASGAISTLKGALMLDPAPAVNAASEIAKRVAFHMDYAKKPPQSNGSTVTGFLSSNRLLDFYFLKQCITREYAKIIDDYFTMFGYAQNKCMTPNMNVRPHWTFVKTLGCSINGNLPADDAAKIEQIFDNGVRFWKDHNKIGKYSTYVAANAPS